MSRDGDLEREIDFQDEQNGRLSERVRELEHTLQEIGKEIGNPVAASMVVNVLNLVLSGLGRK